MPVPFKRTMLQNTAEMWVEMRVPSGLILWEVGSPAGDIALILEGEMGVEVMGSVVARLHDGDLLGESGMYGDGLRSANVRALKETRLLCSPIMI